MMVADALRGEYLLSRDSLARAAWTGGLAEWNTEFAHLALLLPTEKSAA